jgi:hypothetical protein
VNSRLDFVRMFRLRTRLVACLLAFSISTEHVAMATSLSPQRAQNPHAIAFIDQALTTTPVGAQQYAMSLRAGSRLIGASVIKFLDPSRKRRVVKSSNTSDNQSVLNSLMTRGRFIAMSAAFALEIACTKLPPTKVDQRFLRNMIGLLSLLPNRRPGSEELERAFTLVTRVMVATRHDSAREISLSLPGVGRVYAGFTVPAREIALGNIVISAHLDSMSTGADDNASGVAALLEIARLVSHLPVRYNVHFLLLGDEEYNHLGVKAFVKQMSSLDVRPDNTLVINLDSIGQSSIKSGDLPRAERQARIWLTEATLKETHPKAFAPILKNSPLPLKVDKPEIVDPLGEGQSDAALFALYGFPAITISGLPRDQATEAGILHTEKDTPQVVNLGSLAATAQWIADRIGAFASSATPVVQPTAESIPYPPELGMTPRSSTRDVTEDAVRMFYRFGIRFIPHLPIGASELEFLRIWLEYVAERWPSYRQFFKIFDNRLTEYNVAHAGSAQEKKDGVLEYGFPLGLGVIRSPYTADPNTGLAYADRQVVLTHELGHWAFAGAGMRFPGDYGVAFINEKFFNNISELAATDFAFMFLYNELTTGLFLGTNLELKRSGGATVITTPADLANMQPQRRSMVETTFSKVGVRPMVKPFPIARTDVMQWLPRFAKNLGLVLILVAGTIQLALLQQLSDQILSPASTEWLRSSIIQNIGNARLWHVVVAPLLTLVGLFLSSSDQKRVLPASRSHLKAA